MKNVRHLTEGAILLAAFAALIFLTIYIPFFGSILTLAIPVPFILFTSKNNLKYTLAFLVAAGILSFFTGSFIGLFWGTLFGSAGIVMGYLLQRNKSRSVILIASTLTFLFGLVISYVIMAAFFKFDFNHEFTAALNESFKNSQAMLKGMGNEEQVKQLKEQYANSIKLVKKAAPSALIMLSLSLAFITQLVCFPIVKRFGVKVQPWGRIRNLTLPRSLLWYFLIAMSANLLIQPKEGTYLDLVLFNAVYLLQLFMVLQGISLLFFIFHQKSIAKGLQILIVILAFMIPIIHYIIMILGITDLGFDFRKRFEKKE